MRVDLRRVVVPALLVAVVALVAGIGGYFSVGPADKPPAPAQAPQSPFVRGVIQSISADRLTLSTESGSVELRLAANAPVEALRPITVERVAVGDWLNGGAVGHAQTLFALVGLIVIPPGQLESQR
jgi:hypothetical protein